MIFRAAALLLGLLVAATADGDATPAGNDQRRRQPHDIRGNSKLAKKQQRQPRGSRALKRGGAKGGKATRDVLPEDPPEGPAMGFIPTLGGRVCTTDLAVPPQCDQGWVGYVDGEAYGTCGDDCCVGDNACAGLTGYVCKDGSCSGRDSCTGTNVGYIGGYRSIEAKSYGPSCVGEGACALAKGKVIEGGSCAQYAPYIPFTEDPNDRYTKRWWSAQKMCIYAEVDEIQNGSCQGPYACQQAVGPTISSSCRGYASCSGIGKDYDDFNLIQESCNDVCACQIELYGADTNPSDKFRQPRPDMLCECNDPFECRAGNREFYFPACCSAARETGNDALADSAGC